MIYNFNDHDSYYLFKGKECIATAKGIEKAIEASENVIGANEAISIKEGRKSRKVLVEVSEKESSSSFSSFYSFHTKKAKVIVYDDRLASFFMLKKILPKDSTVYCNLKHVSRSGMLRRIDFHSVSEDKSIIFLTGYIARLLSYSMDKNKDGLKVTGCGMDMGFSVVYDLSYALHSNGYALKHSWI